MNGVEHLKIQSNRLRTSTGCTAIPARECSVLADVRGGQGFSNVVFTAHQLSKLWLQASRILPLCFLSPRSYVEAVVVWSQMPWKSCTSSHDTALSIQYDEAKLYLYQETEGWTFDNRGRKSKQIEKCLWLAS